VNSGTPIVLNGDSRYAHDVRAMSAEIAGLAGAPAPLGNRFIRAVADPLLRAIRRSTPPRPEVAV
jgi:hypothetical protein